MNGDAELSAAVSRHFDFTNTPYTADFCTRQTARRRGFPGQKLFLDRILEAGNVQLDIASVYPSSTPAALRRLLNAVAGSGMQRAQQDVVFYYLLKDYDLVLPKLAAARTDEEDEEESEDEERSRAALFASERCLPKVWVVSSEAFWALDNEDWEVAVKHLTNPILTEINFLPEILQTLSTRVSPPPRSLSFIRRLFLHTQSAPETDTEMDLRVIAHASTGSLEDAFSLIRTIEEPTTRSRIREQLWTWMLGVPSFSVGAGRNGAQQDVLRQLTHLPLTDEEAEHLNDFLKRPPRSIPAQNLSILHDLVTLRMIHQGQYADSLELDKASADSAGTDSDRQRRREMVQEFIGILPEVQRRSLAVEGELTASRAQNATDLAINGDIDMDAPARPLTSAPVGIRANASFGSLAQAIPLPSSPAGNATPRNVSRNHSPFSGPPRFASTQQASPDLRHRVMSGPFAPPRIVSSGSPAPKSAPKRLINDDEQVHERRTRKGRRSFGDLRQSVVGQNEADNGEVPAAAEVDMAEPDQGGEPVEEEPVRVEEGPSQVEQKSAKSKRVSKHTKPDDPAQTANEIAGETETRPDESGPSRRTTRRSARASSVASSRAPSETPRTPPPVSPPSTRTRRQTSQPPTPTMPGSFMSSHPVDLPQTVPEGRELDVEQPSALGHGRPPAGGRVTRSVSGAQLDDEEEGKQAGTARKRAKKTREAVSTDLTVPETPRGGRRSTRASTRASTVGPSEQGSPTPSVASVATETRRRTTRAGSAAAQTPRQTRTRR